MIGFDFDFHGDGFARALETLGKTKETAREAASDAQRQAASDERARVRAAEADARATTTARDTSAAARRVIGIDEVEPSVEADTALQRALGRLPEREMRSLVDVWR